MAAEPPCIPIRKYHYRLPSMPSSPRALPHTPCSTVPGFCNLKRACIKSLVGQVHQSWLIVLFPWLPFSLGFPSTRCLPTPRSTEMFVCDGKWNILAVLDGNSIRCSLDSSVLLGSSSPFSTIQGGCVCHGCRKSGMLDITRIRKKNTPLFPVNIGFHGK